VDDELFQDDMDFRQAKGFPIAKRFWQLWNISLYSS